MGERQRYIGEEFVEGEMDGNVEEGFEDEDERGELWSFISCGMERCDSKVAIYSLDGGF